MIMENQPVFAIKNKRRRTQSADHPRPCCVILSTAKNPSLPVRANIVRPYIFILYYLLFIIYSFSET